MQRLTITADDEFVAELDRLIATRGYQNRSEAIRDLARAGMRQTAEEAGQDGNCVAALVYVYDHNARELSKRLTHIFHDHHELSHAALHVHLDHGSCMEVAVLRGHDSQVRHLANAMAWCWAIAAFHSYPVLLGTALLAYSFGLRHAVDADHIAAIDNVARKLIQSGRNPDYTGLYFSLGHSTVVALASLGIALG